METTTTTTPVFRITDVPNLIPVPLVRQSTNYTCGVSAIQSVMYFYGDEHREDRLASSLQANSDDGTSYKKMVEYAKSLGYNVTTQENMTLEDLKNFIDKKQPVIVCLQAWASLDEGDPTLLDLPWKDRWEEGHWAVVIGYDNNRIYFMDPSTLGNYTYIKTEEFLERWHDIDSGGTKLFNFGLIISKPSIIYDKNHIFAMG